MRTPKALLCHPVRKSGSERVSYVNSRHLNAEGGFGVNTRTLWSHICCNVASTALSNLHKVGAMFYHSLFAATFALDLVRATELNGVPIDHGIYDVGEPHWSTFRTRNPIALIAYVIPWSVRRSLVCYSKATLFRCKHCKEFGPVYDELALKIERTMPQLAVARVHWSVLHV